MDSLVAVGKYHVYPGICREADGAHHLCRTTTDEAWYRDIKVRLHLTSRGSMMKRRTFIKAAGAASAGLAATDTVA